MLLEKLHKIDDFLVKAEKIGSALVDKVHAKKRESLVEIVLPQMSWPSCTLGERRESVINGDSAPIWLTRMTAEMTANLSTTAVFNMYRLANGWWMPLETGGSQNPGPFDFEWNFSVGRRQSYYSRDKFASSQLLAGQERGQFLEFKTPILLNTAESLEGVVRATCTSVPTLTTALSVNLKLRFYGFRG